MSCIDVGSRIRCWDGILSRVFESGFGFQVFGLRVEVWSHARYRVLVPNRSPGSDIRIECRSWIPFQNLGPELGVGVD